VHENMPLASAEQALERLRQIDQALTQLPAAAAALATRQRSELAALRARLKEAEDTKAEIERDVQRLRVCIDQRAACVAATGGQTEDSASHAYSDAARRSREIDQDLGEIQEQATHAMAEETRLLLEFNEVMAQLQDQRERAAFLERWKEAQAPRAQAVRRGFIAPTAVSRPPSPGAQPPALGSVIIRPETGTTPQPQAMGSLITATTGQLERQQAALEATEARLRTAGLSLPQISQSAEVQAQSEQLSKARDRLKTVEQLQSSEALQQIPPALGSVIIDASQAIAETTDERERREAALTATEQVLLEQGLTDQQVAASPQVDQQRRALAETQERLSQQQELLEQASQRLPTPVEVRAYDAKDAVWLQNWRQTDNAKQIQNTGYENPTMAQQAMEWLQDRFPLEDAWRLLAFVGKDPQNYQNYDAAIAALRASANDVEQVALALLEWQWWAPPPPRLTFRAAEEELRTQSDWRYEALSRWPSDAGDTLDVLSDKPEGFDRDALRRLANNWAAYAQAFRKRENDDAPAIDMLHLTRPQVYGLIELSGQDLQDWVPYYRSARRLAHYLGQAELVPRMQHALRRAAERGGYQAQKSDVFLAADQEYGRYLQSKARGQPYAPPTWLALAKPVQGAQPAQPVMPAKPAQPARQPFKVFVTQPVKAKDVQAAIKAPAAQPTFPALGLRSDWPSAAPVQTTIKTPAPLEPAAQRVLVQPPAKAAAFKLPMPAAALAKAATIKAPAAQPTFPALGPSAAPVQAAIKAPAAQRVLIRPPAKAAAFKLPMPAAALAEAAVPVQPPTPQAALMPEAQLVPFAREAAAQQQLAWRASLRPFVEPVPRLRECKTDMFSEVQVLGLEKGSASPTVILLGRLRGPTGLCAVEYHYWQSCKQEVAAKLIFVGPQTAEFAALQAELQIYKQLNRLAFEGYTPHFILYIDNWRCSVADLKVGFPTAWRKLAPIVAKHRLMTATQVEVLVLERGEQPLYDWLKSHALSDADLLAIIFQLVYTLAVMDKVGLRHGDLHFGNILVDRLPQPVTTTYLPDPQGKVCYKVTSRWLAKIYDWDHGGIYEPALGFTAVTNELTKEACWLYSACDRNIKADLYMLLGQTYEWVDRGSALKAIIESLIHDKLLEIGPLQGSDKLRWRLCGGLLTNECRPRKVGTQCDQRQKRGWKPPDCLVAPPMTALERIGASFRAPLAADTHIDYGIWESPAQRGRFR
jgi:hypothetical protein